MRRDLRHEGAHGIREPLQILITRIDHMTGREAGAGHVNERLAGLGIDMRIDHRSL